MARTPWQLIDPVTETTLELPINPLEADVPLRANKTYNVQYTTDGTPIVMQGRDEVETFQFSGTILTEEHYNAMVTWFQKSSQINLIDDLNRSFWIVFTEFSPTRRFTSQYPWRHDFSASAIIVSWENTTKIIVDEVPPVAQFSFSPSSGIDNETEITFDPTGSFGGHSDIVEYVWSFGDGYTETYYEPIEVTHTYAAAGSYRVRLTVENALGVTNSVSSVITVSGPSSLNGASSFHVWWHNMTSNRYDEASVTLRIMNEPTVSDLYFWALQLEFTDVSGDVLSGAHTGLQWHPQYPNSNAVNWGGYDADSFILDGSTSSLMSALNNANTRNFNWNPNTDYKFRVFKSGASAPVHEVTTIHQTNLVSSQSLGGDSLDPSSDLNPTGGVEIVFGDTLSSFLGGLAEIPNPPVAGSLLRGVRFKGVTVDIGSASQTVVAVALPTVNLSGLANGSVTFSGAGASDWTAPTPGSLIAYAVGQPSDPVDVTMLFDEPTDDPSSITAGPAFVNSPGGGGPFVTANSISADSIEYLWSVPTTAWRATVTNLSTMSTTIIRDLYCYGDRIYGMSMWTEAFASCSAPTVTVHWKDMECVVYGTSTVIEPQEFYITYQSAVSGGCHNTNSSLSGTTIVQSTNVQRTQPHDSYISIGSGSSGWTPSYPLDTPPGFTRFGATLTSGESGVYAKYEAPIGGLPLAMHREFISNWSNRSQLTTKLINARNKGRGSWLSIKTPDWGDVTAGTYDNQIDAVLTSLKNTGIAVWLSPFHEPENNPEMGTAAEWRSMIRRFEARRVVVGADNVLIVPILMDWTFNTSSGRTPSDWLVSESAFPVYGVDFYTDNFETSPAGFDFQMWNNIVDKVINDWGKDLAIGEFGGEINSGEIRPPGLWNAMVAEAEDLHIRAVCWFDNPILGLDPGANELGGALDPGDVLYDAVLETFESGANYRQDLDWVN